jgi:hypothetical protein
MAGMSLRIEGENFVRGVKDLSLLVSPRQTLQHKATSYLGYHCSCSDIFDLCLRPIRPGCSLHYIAPRKVVVMRLLKMASTNRGGDGSVVASKARPTEYFPLNKSTYLRSLLFPLYEFLTICVLHSERTRSFTAFM